ncbi:MAG: GNAT family N-acetyltransferase [Nitrospirae bacterium]|nr:GNAT family N-acetyltransferase [Nitrospirota bacterium]
MTEARLVTTDESFKELEPVWNGLLIDSDHSTPFMSWEWLSTWWKHFGSGRLQITALWRNGELVGAAPLHQARGPWGMTSLRMLGTVQSDYLDFLVRKEDSDALYSGLLRQVLTSAGSDLILLDQVPPNRVDILTKAARAGGFYLQVKERGHCYSVGLPSKWEEYLCGLGTNERYNIGRRTRTLERRHGVSFRRAHEPGGELEKRVEEFFRLLIRRLDMRGRRLTVAEESSLRFHKDLAQGFARRGWMNLCWLEHQERMIAGLFTFEYDRRLFYYHAGFDPDWAKYSVGMVLLAKCIEDGIGRGVCEFDFMRGRAAYKWKWNVRERPFYRVGIARDSVRYLKLLGSGLAARVGKLLKKTGSR